MFVFFAWLMMIVLQMIIGAREITLVTHEIMQCFYQLAVFRESFYFEKRK